MRTVIRGQMEAEAQIASLKVEIDRLHQVGSEEMNRIGRKISKKL